MQGFRKGIFICDMAKVVPHFMKNGEPFCLNGQLRIDLDTKSNFGPSVLYQPPVGASWQLNLNDLESQILCECLH